jgi:prolyl-tRNA synthetase
MAYDKQIPKKAHNLSDWYIKTIQDAELADYGPAKGTMIFRPYGYRIWELIQAGLDIKIKARGVDNAYFPLFIPESLLNKEKDHVDGFAPELAIVTIGGGEELEEKLIVRPTSETIMYESYSKWIQSYRDLPLLINQWNNVVRWEKRTYPFMRTSEFLWQEGHTAHATHEEAIETQKWAMTAYVEMYRDFLAIPGYIGYKSASEKFAGAFATLTYETLMPEGKALQSCTSHDLGQNFSKPFDITYQSKEGVKEYVWQTSWGFSTRSLGGLFMTHGDDNGLVLPPVLAPFQVVIIPVRSVEGVAEYCQQLANTLSTAGIRVKLDDRDGESFGYKINKWELKGVPLRFEIGPREVEEGSLVAVKRGKVKLEATTMDKVADLVRTTLNNIQVELLASAESFLEEHTHSVDSYDEFKRIMASSRGFIRALWCEDALCEQAIKDETTATTRCLPLDAKDETGVCVRCLKPAQHRWVFALSY